MTRKAAKAMTASTTTYTTGAIKRDPATMAVAIRTTAVDDPAKQWAVMTVDRGGRYAAETELSDWDDVPIG